MQKLLTKNVFKYSKKNPIFVPNKKLTIMKLFTLFCSLAVLSFGALNAQNENKKNVDFYVQVGAGMGYSSFSNSMLNFTGAINVVLNDEHQIILSEVDGAGFKNDHHPRVMYSSVLRSASYGIRNNLGKRWYFTPSIGIGMQTVQYTSSSYDQYTWDHMDQLNDQNALANTLTLGLFGISPKYELIKKNNVALPVSVTFMKAGRVSGFSIALSFVVSQNPELGATFLWDIGKIRAKK